MLECHHSGRSDFCVWPGCNSHLFSSLLWQGFAVGPQSIMPDQFSDVHRSISPASAAQQQVTLFCPATNQQGLHVWSGCELYMLAVGNALLGLQTFSFLKTKQFKLLFQLVVEKMETLVYRCEGASIFSSGLCFCFSRWGRYRCQQLGQTWRHWPYNRSLPCMPINHSSLVTNNNKIKLFEIGKVCLWLSEQKPFVFVKVKPFWT